MATIQRSPPLEIRHEPQQSHDSGAYIDWNSESGSPTRKNSGSEVEVSVPGKVASEEFVTVVSVEGDGSTGAVVVVADEDANKKSAVPTGESTVSLVEVPFVTVLSVGGDAPVVSSENTEEKTAISLDVSGKEASKEVHEVQIKETERNIMTALLTDGEEVLVYRLPGERLGFGLKFEGGTKTAERVRRLFIQSCAAESPASRARCSWGGLGEGDEVLEIDAVPVNLMTRLDCVRRLKESRVVITLRVRPAPGRITPMVVEAEPPSEPPPVPPRKGQRRASAPKVEEAPPPPVGFGDEGVSNGQRRRASEGDATAVALSMRQRVPLSPGPIGRNRFSPEHPVPPEAETYIDLLAQEEYAARNCESESDDTGSSISTVVDRLSLNSVSALSSASSENRSPEHGPYGSTIDLARVLDPFERLEREFSSDSEFTQARHTVTSVTTETRVINGDLMGKTEKEISPVTMAINVPAATGLEDDLALQPPPSFQDIPLDDGDGQSIRSSQSSESTEHETSTEERQEVPRLPPKPAPRKEGHRFRSGKKRPPPPPPPPPSRVEQQTWQTPEEKEDPTVEKQESVIDAIVEKDLLPMDEIDLSPERVEEEIEKVAEMLRNEGREGRLLDEVMEETMEVTIVGGIEKEISIKIIEDISEDKEREAVDKELADEVIVRDMDIMEGIDNKEEEEEDDEDEVEEEEEVEEDDEDDDLMIDSRLSEELWKSGPTDVLFPHFHWSVTQLATIGEDEEEQTDSDNRSTPERLSVEGDVESLSEEEGKQGVPGQKSEEEAGESGAEELRVAAESEVGEDEGSAGETAPLAPQHLRQNHLRDRPEGNGEEVVEGGAQLPDVRVEEVSGEVDMPVEATSVGEEGVEGAEDTASNTGDDQEAQIIKDPCADITAALGPALSPVSCETAPTDGEAVRAPIKGSSAKTEEVSPSDGPLCSTPTETKQVNGSSSSVLLEQSPVAADDYEKGATSLQEDLQVTSPSNDTGLGNMDSLLSIKSSSEISNGLSHSLEDSSLPPSFSRLPPDGHEFPPNYQEPSRITSNGMTSDPSLKKTSESKTIMDSPPDTPPPPLPTSCPPQKDLSEAAPAPGKPLPPPPPARKPPPKDFNSRLPPRPSGERRHWMKDEKSEKSVRDKIAMFQRETKEEIPPPATSAPPIPAARSPFKLDVPEERSRKSCPPQWGEDVTRGRSHLSRSMVNVDGTGRGGDHTSPTLYPPTNLYKGGVHSSTGDVSAGIEGVDGSRTLDFARTRSNLDLTSSSNSCSPDSSLSSASSYSSGGVYATLPRKPIATQRPPIAAERNTSVLENRPSSPDSSSWKTPTYSPSNRSGNLHSRSQSLIDVGSPKRHSYAGSYNYKYGINGNDEARKSSLNALIEQRRRNVSKLRGLVIPEKTEVARCDQSLFDLPEIKSRDAIILNDKCKTATLPRCESKQTNKWSENMNGHSAKSQNNNNFANNNSNNGVTLSSPPWKSQAPLPDLPKYSPAFKRRTLSVHGLTTTSLESSREELRSQDQSKLHPPSKPPRTSNGYGFGPSSPLGPEPKSLESITSPRSDSSFDFSPICHTDSPKEEEVVPVIKTNGSTGSYGDSHNGKSIHRGLLHVPSRGASAEDSDNDSAVSSSRSSISHGFSPPSSPLPGDTSDGGLRPSAPRQHNSRDRLQAEDRSRLSTSQRRSSGNIVERASSPEKRPLRRTLSSETTASVSSAASTASTVTSGSHDGGNASDSSSNRRVLKAQSVEAINRKNVLASAKYSSGRDLKVGSPLIKRKFEEDGSGTEADVEDTAKAENSGSRTNGAERISMHYKTTREINGIHDIEATRNMDIKVAYVDEIIEFPFVNGAVDCSVPIPAQRRIYTSPRPTSPVSEYSTTESVCDSHKEDKKSGVKGLDESESAAEDMGTPKTSPTVPLDRWMELEKKYAPKMSPMETRTSMEAQESPYKGHILEDEIDYLSRKVGGESEKSRVKSLAEKQKDTGNGFRAIAEKWQIISNDASTLPSPTNPVAAVTASSATSSAASNGQGRKNSRRSSSSGADAARASPETAHPKAEEPLRIPPPPESAPPPVPHSNGEATHSEAVRLREKKSPVARPVSFNGCGEKTLTVSSAYTIQETRTTMSRQESTPEPRTPPSPAPAPVTAAQRASNRRSVSVNDIRKAFEKVELSTAANGKASSVTRTKGTAVTTVHTRVSSLDSTTSEDSSMQTSAHYGSANNLASNHRDQFGSVTSLASSTSLISPQELQQLIEEANQSLDETSPGGGPSVHEVEVVVLHREMAGSSVGITLAGGADYEAKEITVHKVLAGSPAERDGRLQRGDRILSINGKSMKGATHREAISILKAPRSEVVFVVSRSRHENSQPHQSQQHSLQQGANGGADVSLPTVSTTSIRSSSRPPRIVEQPSEGSGGENSEETAEKKEDDSRGPPETITLTKDGAGLGFSLEGGKDSPCGDKPLTIKKIFTGGAAEKHGGLNVGDELLVVNGVDVTPLSRIEAWGIMKKLPDGLVLLTIRRKI